MIRTRFIKELLPFLFLPFAFSVPVLNGESARNILMISVDDMRDWTNFLGGYKGEVHTFAFVAT